MLQRLAATLQSMVTRARVTAAEIGPRTLLQLTGYENETREAVELLLPPGYSARPPANVDLLMLEVGGSRDHVVALGGDNLGVDAIADLAPGEFGLRHATGAQIVLRNTGHVKITDPSGAVWEMTNNGTIAVTGTLMVTGNIVATGDISDQDAAHGTLAAFRGVYNSHTHPDPQGGNSGIPNELTA